MTRTNELIITYRPPFSHSCLSIGGGHISCWKRTIQQILIHKDCRVSCVHAFTHICMMISKPNLTILFVCAYAVYSCLYAFTTAPGLVTNLTAFAQNHTFVVVTWFLPHRINGLITKFAVKAKYARTGQVVRTLEVNAEDIMTGALPHCNVQCCII